MKLVSIQYPVFNPYDKSTVELYFSGCTRRCRGCHNPELANFDMGDELDEKKIKEVIDYLKLRDGFFDIISFTGGDPLCNNHEEFLNFVSILKKEFQHKEFWLFTGADKEELKTFPKYYFDVIKCGSYNEKLKQEGFPASSNQKILKKGKDYL